VECGFAMPVREPEQVSPELSLAGFADGPFARSRHATYPVDLGDGAFGLISYRDLARVPYRDWPDTRVRDVATRAEELLVVDPDDELGDALVEIAETEGRRALVLDRGRLAALLSITDVSGCSSFAGWSCRAAADMMGSQPPRSPR
jgi:CBS domain-containing protein